jgi:hypothetical protein
MAGSKRTLLLNKLFQERFFSVIATPETTSAYNKGVCPFVLTGQMMRYNRLSVS